MEVGGMFAGVWYEKYFKLFYLKFLYIDTLIFNF